MSTFKEASQSNWTSRGSVEHINAGSLQRIADAVEKVALNYDQLLRSKKYADEAVQFWRELANRRARSNASLRGYITKLKRNARATP